LGKIVEMMRIGDNEMPVHSEVMRGKIIHAKFGGPGVVFYASRPANTQLAVVEHQHRSHGTHTDNTKRSHPARIGVASP
jgi:hypothetical protein